MKNELKKIKNLAIDWLEDVGLGQEPNTTFGLILSVVDLCNALEQAQFNNEHKDTIIALLESDIKKYQMLLDMTKEENQRLKAKIKK